MINHIMSTITSVLSGFSAAVFLNLVILFIVKVFDNMLGTHKTILIQQNKGVFAGINVGISQIIFYKLINAVGSSGNDLALYVIAIASGLGTYIAMKINQKKSKDKVYINALMSDDKEALIALGNYLKSKKITYTATDGYTLDWQPTICVTAYPETKDESRLLDKYIDEFNNTNNNYIDECNTKIKRVVA